MNSSLKDVIVLLIQVWKNMPFLTTVWIVVPVCAGFTIIPVTLAQRELIDYVVNGIGTEWEGILKMILPTLVLFASASLLQVFLNSIRKIISVTITNKSTMYIQTEIHNLVQRVPLEKFEESGFYDKLQRAKSAAGKDMVDIFNNFIEMVRMLFTLSGILIISATGHWSLPILIGSIMILVLFLRVKTEIAVRRLNREMTFDGRMADYIKSTLNDSQSMKEIKIFGAVSFLMNRWITSLRQQNNRRFESRRKEIKLGAFISFIQILGIFISLIIMFSRVKAELITAGTIVVVFQVMLQSQSIAFQITWPISKLYIQSSKASDLMDFLNIQVEHNKNIKAEKPSSKVEIQFHNVSFKYPHSDKYALKDISVIIHAGVTIAIAGDNGAGKSTFVRLLLGLYKPTSGNITWDGVDYQDLDPKELYSRMSAVFQDFQRYQLTLRENIAFGDLGKLYEDDILRSALVDCSVNVDSNVMDDLDISLGRLSEGGLELSGGQWQRIAITRALIRNADLIVLDEPTSAIDPSAEINLYRSFRELAQGKTALFVSHRLGWARYSDRILMFKYGNLVESGTHIQLMERGGSYYQAFKAQASWYEEVAPLTNF